MTFPSLDFYRSLLEDSPQATLVYAKDRACQWVSPGFARWASRPQAYWGQPLGALLEDVHDEDRAHACEALEAAWSTQGSVPLLLRLRVRSGDYRLVEVTPSNQLEGPVGGLVLHLTPVVDRKRAEDLLLSERERLLVTLRSIGDGVVATDVEGRVTLLNAVTESLTGWSQAEALGRPLAEVYRVVSQDNHSALVSRTGQLTSIEDTAAPIRDMSGKVIGAVLVFRDVTEARRTAAERNKMQKLESIGVLAGGIAHDFNNLLTAILGNASLGSLLVEPEHPVLDLLNGIVQASRRASRLTQQLLTFSKGGAPVLEPTKAPDLVEETARFVLVGSATRCEFEWSGTLEPVLADPGQLAQVVQNLVLNASQAMASQSTGGRLVIRGRTMSRPDSVPLPAGSYVCLEFADEGPGIAAEHLDKIFEPYFTTKPDGNGLGLTVVWSIVKGHGGWVQVESPQGRGTTFTVWLPATPAETKSSPPASPSRHRGTALVMDDEDDPRRTMVVMLRHLGFDCRSAESGEQALELSAQGKVDLAVVDLTVKGGMGGREVLPLLKATQPLMKVIVTSGYSIDPVLSNFSGYGFDGVVRKPFTLADLTLAIDEAMGRR